MLTSPAQRASKSSLVVPIILGIVLVPLSQVAVAYLGGRWGSLIGWAVGTPICYFLIGGMAAFITVSGLVPAQARGMLRRTDRGGRCCVEYRHTSTVRVTPPSTGQPHATLIVHRDVGAHFSAGSDHHLARALLSGRECAWHWPGTARRDARRIPESPRKPTSKSATRASR
jgi:hypothetical protein